MTEQIAEQIRQTIRDSEVSLNSLALACDVAYSRLHEFMAGGDIKLSNAQKLASYFGLQLEPPKRRKRQ